MHPPKGPLPLVDMEALKAELERRRQELFPLWKAAIIESEGNITEAGQSFGLTGRQGAMAARWLCARLGLIEFARNLRWERGDYRGRPPKDTTPPRK